MTSGLRDGLHRLWAVPQIRRGGLLISRSVREYFDDHCPQMAAAIAYHVVFSLFPLAIAGVGVLGLLTGTDKARETVTSAVVKVIPLNDQGRAQLHDLLVSIGDQPAPTTTPPASPGKHLDRPTSITRLDHGL